MAYLLVSTVAALAVAISAFGATGSLFLAFLAYSGTGTLVLMTALLAGIIGFDADD